METKTLVRRLSAGAALCGFLIILISVTAGDPSGFDDPVREFFYGLRCGPMTAAARGLTMLANKYLIIGLCLLLLIIPKTRVPYGIPLSAGALGVTVLNSVIKHIVARPRPEVLHLTEEAGFSFPSGHSITSMFFYGLAIWLICRNFENKKAARICTALLLIPFLLIGPTRIYLGVHYPTDVLAGWFLGFTALAIEAEILERL